MIGLHKDRIDEFLTKIGQINQHFGPLPGIATAPRRHCWAQQIVSSLRRISYTDTLLVRAVDSLRCVPYSGIFDPIRGVLYLHRNGHLDEAVWLTFILTHFGKHAVDEWKLAENVYGSFGVGPTWTFAEYTSNVAAFENMLAANQNNLENVNVSGRFSNHRKFESKKPQEIAKTFRTFHEWQTEFGDFRERLIVTHAQVGQEPQATFDALYKSMRNVSRFGRGRLGRFDFLTMLGKLQIAPIFPGSVYLDKASGPLDGARLLLFGDRKHKITGKALEPRVDALDDILQVGKQVIEDSLCNWQKSPDAYVYFRG
ncbi:alpha-glutamyl/putrescinyl thymine pyrophosphorylase clade 3 protein [Aquamicrobium terrae]